MFNYVLQKMFNICGFASSSFVFLAVFIAMIVMRDSVLIEYSKYHITAILDKSRNALQIIIL